MSNHTEKLKKEHPYQKYHPKWCGYPPFHGMDYCWGLANVVDGHKKMGKEKIMIALKEFCKDCDLKRAKKNPRKVV